MSWLLSPSSATKMTAVLNRKAYMGFVSPSRQAEENVSVTSLRPGTSEKWVRVLVESLVRHRSDPVAHRTGPGGQCVDAAIGDYSLSSAHDTRRRSRPTNSSQGRPTSRTAVGRTLC